MEEKTNRPEPALSAEIKSAPSIGARKFEIKRDNSSKKFIIAGIVVVALVAVAVSAIVGLKKGASDKAAISKIKDETQVSLFTLVTHKDGEITMAGRNTEVGARVIILSDGVDIGQSDDVADENGEWLFFPKSKLKPGDHELSAYYVNKAGQKIESSEVINVHVPKLGEKKGDAWYAKIDRRTGKAKVLGAPLGDNIGALRLRSIDYNESGELGIEGLGKKGAIVQIYINNVLLAKTRVDDAGNYRVDMKKVLENKTYKIRVDMLDANGKKVAARIEQAFNPDKNFVPVEGRKYVVQKGDNLWNIARREYGSGFQWVIIYKDNMAQIADPDLIYPSQTLVLVSREEAAKISVEDKRKLYGKSKKGLAKIKK
jgi:hypothetical protein